MEDYKFVSVVFQVPGGKELKYKADDTESWAKLTAAAQAAAQNPETEFLFPDDFDSVDSLIGHLAAISKSYTTYGTIRVYVKQGDDEVANLEALREAVAYKGSSIGSISLVDNTFTMQLLKLFPGLTQANVTPRDERPDPADYLEGKAINPES